ncbi:MAG: hypothetical protein J0G30_10080 [Actinomycetales bacterium]|nr:hypothetical protein [Actinomycetales bacterium]
MSDPTASERPEEAVPPIPPAPRYGEYAPGYGPEGPLDPSNPAPIPGAPAPAPAWGAPGQPGVAAAPAQPGGYPGAPYPGPAAYPGYALPPGYPTAPQGRRRRTWDLVLSIVLFVLGLFGMGLGLLYAAIFSDPALISQTTQQAYGFEFTGDPGAWPAAIAISHVVLYLLGLGLGILALVKRVVAFWIPLVAGAIAAIVFWVGLTSILLSDPAFLGAVS